MGNPADSLMPDFEEYEAARQLNYEESVVRFILRKTQMLHLESWLRDMTHGVTEGEHLSMYNFAAHTGFPMWLATDKLRHLHEEKWLTDNLADAIHHRFTKTPLYGALMEAVAGVPPEFEDLSVGVVFHWPGRSKFTVLHDRPDIPGRGRGMFIWAEKHKPWWIQDLADLLLDLGSSEDW